MTDDCHFLRDPKSLIDARLTSDEVAALASYRSARDDLPEANLANIERLVVVLPVTRALLLDGSASAVDALALHAAAAVREQIRRYVEQETSGT